MKLIILCLMICAICVSCTSTQKDTDNSKETEKKVSPEDTQKEQDPPKEEDPPKQEEPKKSLYERLGGDPAIEKAVDIFYAKVLQDDRINSFFGNTDIERQKAKQKSFLIMVFGGPAEYTGDDLRGAHRHLVETGLTDNHFDAVVELLGETLRELGVGDVDINEVVKICESVRDDVLNREK